MTSPCLFGGNKHKTTWEATKTKNEACSNHWAQYLYESSSKSCYGDLSHNFYIFKGTRIK